MSFQLNDEKDFTLRRYVGMVRTYFDVVRKLVYSGSNFAFNIPAQTYDYPETQKGIQWKAEIIPGKGIRLYRASEQTDAHRSARNEFISRVQEAFPGGHCQRKIGISIIALRQCHISPKTCVIHWVGRPDQELVGFIHAPKRREIKGLQAKD